MNQRKLRDIIRLGTTSDAVDAVSHWGTQLGMLADHIRANFDRSEKYLSLHNLVSRTAQEMLRLARNHDQGVEFVAWATRNAFELNLAVRYVLISSESAKAYLAEAAKDEQQILEGVISLADDPSSEDRKGLEKRIAEIDAIARRHGQTLHKPPSTSQLARLVDCTADYKALFKFMSKYVHPSSWLVNYPPTETQNEAYWSILMVHAQRYAVDTHERIRTVLAIPQLGIRTSHVAE